MKSYGILVTFFARTFIVITHETHLHQSANNALVYLERHLNGSVPTLMEDLSVLWSKEIYLRV